MNRLCSFAAFLYDFIVGDDPLIAITIIATLAATAAIVGAGVNAWWLVPPATIGALAISLKRATKR